MEQIIDTHANRTVEPLVWRNRAYFKQLNSNLFDHWHAVYVFNLKQGQRQGQAMMNALYKVDWELYRLMYPVGQESFYEFDIFEETNAGSPRIMAWLKEVWGIGA